MAEKTCTGCQATTMVECSILSVSGKCSKANKKGLVEDKRLKAGGG